jgi:energy-converting hydrogenase A subunit R
LNNRKIFISDCEGPLSKNDNAFELTANFVPDGEKVFALVSRYDDVLADVLERPGYEAGTTLKLVVPFLKAYEVDDQAVRKYSEESLSLVPGAKGTLRFVSSKMHAFIISTSYQPYMSAFCDFTGFPIENTYCTKLSLDAYVISREEKERLKMFRKEIAAMPMIEIPKKAESLIAFSERDRKTIERLDRIFWQEILKMGSRTVLEEVNPVGGKEKAEAIKEIVATLDSGLSEVMHVGDSITDVASFQFVRDGGGLVISFNGNEYAVQEAEIAVLADNTIVTSILADVFNRSGRHGVTRLVEMWERSLLEKHSGNIEMLRELLKLYPEKLPEVEIVTDENREDLSRRSTVFRKKVRGEAVGRLG